MSLLKGYRQIVSMIHLSEDFSSSRLGNFVNFSLMVSKSEKKKKKKKNLQKESYL